MCKSAPDQRYRRLYQAICVFLALLLEIWADIYIIAQYFVKKKQNWKRYTGLPERECDK